MSPTKLALAAALIGLPALAHHEATTSGAFLAFWSGSAQPPAVEYSSGTCSDSGFWEKGFVSIYSQGTMEIQAR